MCSLIFLTLQLILVVVEDLHWADSGTLDMLLTFLQAGLEDPWSGGCMFAFTTRPSSSFPTHTRNTRDKLANVRCELAVCPENVQIHMPCTTYRETKLTHKKHDSPTTVSLLHIHNRTPLPWMCGYQQTYAVRHPAPHPLSCLHLPLSPWFGVTARFHSPRLEQGVLPRC